MFVGASVMDTAPCSVSILFTGWVIGPLTKIFVCGLVGGMTDSRADTLDSVDKTVLDLVVAT